MQETQAAGATPGGTCLLTNVVGLATLSADRWIAGGAVTLRGSHSSQPGVDSKMIIGTMTARRSARIIRAVMLGVLAVFTLIPSVLATDLPSLYPPPPPEAPLLGDVNEDGSVNIIDAMFIAQYSVGLRSLSDAQKVAADTTGDKAVNIVDAMHIAQYSVDPTGNGGVLFKPLWEFPEDSGTWDPRGLNAGWTTGS